MQCYKVVAVRIKKSPRTFAARRLVPRNTTKKIKIGIQIVAKSAGSEDPDLNYFSMGSARQPSRDTVPLRHLYSILVVINRNEADLLFA
jgi:hypothetical protein